mmetsp:Transcript_35388/g.71707  ORF Transcript_35388/g.71707 Transcript_35388/m.71707 type:complete len:357 (+) Transcript_35388:1463-2533(+)
MSGNNPSYRHGTKAGNYVDVHKHIGLLCVLADAASKHADRKLCYIETHSGSGSYSSTSGKSESSGIGKVLTAATQGKIQSPEIRAYVDTVEAYRSADTTCSDDDAAQHKKADGTMRYPGSPALAFSALRAGDEAVLAELQSDVAQELMRTVFEDERSAALKVDVEIGDGYSVLRKKLAKLSEASAVGSGDTETPSVPLVLIDPPYMDTEGELDNIPLAVADGLKCSQDAIVLVWYPVKEGKDDLLLKWKKDVAAAVTGALRSEDVEEPNENRSDSQSTGARRKSAPDIVFSEIWTGTRITNPIPKEADDAQPALVGSGLVLVHRSAGMNESITSWTAELHNILDPDGRGSWSILEC